MAGADGSNKAPVLYGLPLSDFDLCAPHARKQFTSATSNLCLEHWLLLLFIWVLDLY